MKNEGILFYLSGEQGSVPEIAAGNPTPNFFKDVEVIENGRKGKALRCLPTQLLAYWAPGNMYSQRGDRVFLLAEQDAPWGQRNFRCSGCLLQITPAGTRCLCASITTGTASTHL